ncbi:MAG: hypothetical protein KH452_02290 [Clostridiales bacterium]|nr:hypothetical protein [Clostridiales bacterium]
MGEVFFKLLNMSLTAGWMILAVMCFRLIFRRTPRWVNCFMWSLVAIRLICPFSIESTFALLSATEPIKDYAVVEGETQDYIPSISSDWQIVQNSVNPMLADSFAYDESASVAPLQVVTHICGIVWGFGVILFVLYAVISLFRLHLRVREAVPYKDNILICDAVKSPFILGIVKPRIYISSGLQENEIKYIAAHEHAHLKRGDHWWKSLGYLLLCVYWFHPLCWIAYILFCKDIELACDEKVIRDMDIQDKKEYSRTLLACACRREMVFAYPLAFGEVGIKERVRSILNYKKPAFWLTAVSAAVCVIIAVCFLTTAPRKYQIRVTIPAGGMESFYYSDEEISPKGNRLTLSAGEGLGDTEVVLLPVEVKQENAYDAPTYLTPGMPVKMDVEKGAWFKIGVNVQNPAEEDMDVYVEVENVDVRIASVVENSTASDDYYTVLGEQQKNTEEFTVEKLLSLCNAGSEALQEAFAIDTEGGELPYSNLIREEGEEWLTWMYRIPLAYNGREYELQVSYWVAETAEEYGYTENELSDIRIVYPAMGDGQLLYDVDERYTPDLDVQSFLVREYDISKYVNLELPAGLTLGKYNMDFNDIWQGCLLKGDYEEPAHGEFAQESKYAPGGIGLVEMERFSDRVQFENNILQAVEWRMNHGGRDSEYEIIEGCDRQAILCEYSFDLFTAPEAEEYINKYDLEEEELQTTSRYWYVFFAEQDSDYVYTLFLNQEHFTKDDIIKLARTLKFMK